MARGIDLLALLLALGALAYPILCAAAVTRANGLTTKESAPAIGITIHLDQPAKPISPDLFGIFFEDINYAADGGLYWKVVETGVREAATEFNVDTIRTGPDAETNHPQQANMVDGIFASNQPTVNGRLAWQWPLSSWNPLRSAGDNSTTARCCRRSLQE